MNRTPQSSLFNHQNIAHCDRSTIGWLTPKSAYRHMCICTYVEISIWCLSNGNAVDIVIMWFVVFAYSILFMLDKQSPPLRVFNCYDKILPQSRMYNGLGYLLSLCQKTACSKSAVPTPSRKTPPRQPPTFNFVFPGAAMVLL